MGNSASSGRGHHDETVDFGSLYPQGVYTGPQDWNQAVVAQLIVQRRLAPFYRPLEDYEESWDDEQILAALRELPDPESGHSDSASTKTEGSTSKSHHHKRSNTQKEINRGPEAAIYRGAIECPICFLYYPENINHSRCCDQAICTECFVQIKRSEPTTTHMVSDPASCPYCVQENFGVVYKPPSWRTGIGSEGSTPPSWPDSPKSLQPSVETTLAATKRRRSFGPDSPEVVTIDQIRPDWEAKLAAVQAAAQRRANRRIIMRQVGDRLIPVGVTSGRIHALPAEEAENTEGSGNGGGSRRSRRRQQNPDLQQILGQVGMAGQDLEEMMIMEAMRLSLIDHEDQQRRQREEEVRNQRNEEGASATTDTPATAVAQAPSSFPGAPTLQSSITAPSVSTQISEDNRASHHSSASLSAMATDSMWNRRRSASPPFSALSAAMSAAASTASAISSPREDVPSTTVADEARDAVSNLPTPQQTTPALAPELLTPSAESIVLLPPMNRSESSYDVLPSSPESSVSQVPLLGSGEEAPHAI